MTAVDIVLPAEIDGEDLANPPHPPIPAVAVIAARWPEASAEFDGPLRHDGWAAARADWHDLTLAEQNEHREVCAPSTGGPCVMCEGHREFGACPSCERIDAEIVAGQTLCCDVRGLQGDEFDRWWGA